jgi:hypothetical protein
VAELSADRYGTALQEQANGLPALIDGAKLSLWVPTCPE